MQAKSDLNFNDKPSTPSPFSTSSPRTPSKTRSKRPASPSDGESQSDVEVDVEADSDSDYKDGKKSTGGGNKRSKKQHKSPAGKAAAQHFTQEEDIALQRACTQILLHHLSTLSSSPGLERRRPSVINNKLRARCVKVLESLGDKGAKEFVKGIKLAGKKG